MTDYKFEIGNTVYFDGVTREYQLENPFTITHRKVETTTISGEEDNYEITVVSYSSDGWSWYPENALTTELTEV